MKEFPIDEKKKSEGPIDKYFKKSNGGQESNCGEDSGVVVSMRKGIDGGGGEIRKGKFDLDLEGTVLEGEIIKPFKNKDSAFVVPEEWVLIGGEGGKYKLFVAFRSSIGSKKKEWFNPIVLSFGAVNPLVLPVHRETNFNLPEVDEVFFFKNAVYSVRVLNTEEEEIESTVSKFEDIFSAKRSLAESNKWMQSVSRLIYLPIEKCTNPILCPYAKKTAEIVKSVECDDLLKDVLRDENKFVNDQTLYFKEGSRLLSLDFLDALSADSTFNLFDLMTLVKRSKGPKLDDQFFINQANNRGKLVRAVADKIVDVMTDLADIDDFEDDVPLAFIPRISKKKPSPIANFIEGGRELDFNVKPTAANNYNNNLGDAEMGDVVDKLEGFYKKSLTFFEDPKKRKQEYNMGSTPDPKRPKANAKEASGKQSDKQNLGRANAKRGAKSNGSEKQ